MENDAQLTPAADANPGVTQDNLDDLYLDKPEEKAPEPPPELTAAQERIAELEARIAAFGDPARPHPAGPDSTAMFEATNRQIAALAQAVGQLVSRPMTLNAPPPAAKQWTAEEYIEAFKNDPRGLTQSQINEVLNQRLPGAHQVLLRKIEEVANRLHVSQKEIMDTTNETAAANALSNMTQDVLDRCEELGLGKEDASRMLTRINDHLKMTIKNGQIDDYFPRVGGLVKGNRLSQLVDQMFGTETKTFMTRAEERAEERRKEKLSGTLSLMPGGRSMIPNPGREPSFEEKLLRNVELNEGRRRR